MQEFTSVLCFEASSVYLLFPEKERPVPRHRVQAEQLCGSNYSFVYFNP